MNPSKIVSFAEPSGVDSSSVQTGEFQIGKAKSNLDHWLSLDINAPTTTHRMTSIMCSIDPTSLQPKVIKELIEKGMSIALISLQNNSLGDMAATINTMRDVFTHHSQTEGFSVPIALGIDTKGPEIQTGKMKYKERGGIELKNGSSIRVSWDYSYSWSCTDEQLYINCEYLDKVLKVNDPIYLAEGAIKLICKKFVPESEYLVCLIEKGGVIESEASVRIPTAMTTLPTLTENDVKAVAMARSHALDFVFVSFVRSTKCIESVKKLLNGQSTSTKLIVKIDNCQALNIISEIMHVADGIMVDRAGLQYELSSEKIYAIQKKLIARCRKFGLPVIVVNQMLDSMIKSSPTRFEVCDIANAVQEGVDCLLLHKETSEWPTPVQSIIELDSIVRDAEKCTWSEQMYSDLTLKLFYPAESTVTMARMAVGIAHTCGAKIIIVLTTTGRTANIIANYRPLRPIIAVCKNPMIARQLNIYRGIFPLHFSKKLPLCGTYEHGSDMDARVMYGVRYAVHHDLVKMFEPVVIVSGCKSGAGFTNTVRIEYASAMFPM